MSEIKNTFLKGKMNKDLDERLVPNGEYIDAINIEVSTSEGSGIGVIENILGNKNVGGSISGLNETFKCVGTVTDEKTNRIYWFVHSPEKDAILEYDYFTRETHTILCDLYFYEGHPDYSNGVNANGDIKAFLKFSGKQITGINIIDDFLFWTDGESEPKKFNITTYREAQKKLGNSLGKTVNHHSHLSIDGVLKGWMQEEYLTVVKRRPTSAPNIIKNPISSTNTLPIFEEIFPRFAYRYKYVDGEYSAISPFSTVAFNAIIPEDNNIDNYFSTEESHNTAMVNNLSSISVTDFVPSDIPRDVVQIDILYKQENSSVIYSVTSVKPEDDEWNHSTLTEKGGKARTTLNDFHARSIQAFNKYKATGRLTINTQNLRGALPENQILRTWDNVPKKAISQEITGNRIVYGNYTQGYDLVAADGSRITPKITGGYEQRDNLDYHFLGATGDGLRSLKTLRDYQIGVTYVDFYGRETPVFVSENSDVKIPWENTSLSNNSLTASNSLSATATLTSKIPYWAEYCKFYIKETSGEYYNLVMSDAYLPGSYNDFNNDDDHIWMAFASTDINKLSLDDYVIIKKILNPSGPQQVRWENKYKILDIKEQAPDAIKYRFHKLGAISNTDSTLDSLFTNDAFRIDSLTEGVGQDVIHISRSIWQNNGGALLGSEVEEDQTYLAQQHEDIYISWSVDDGQVSTNSQRYKCAGVRISDGNYIMNLTSTVTEEDATIAASGGTLLTDLQFRVERKSENDGEDFSGKFFVKVKVKDDSFHGLVNLGNSTTGQEMVVSFKNALYLAATDAVDGEDYNSKSGVIGAAQAYSTDLMSADGELTDVSIAAEDLFGDQAYESWDILSEGSAATATSNTTYHQRGFFFIDRMPFTAGSLSLDSYAKNSGDPMGHFDFDIGNNTLSTTGSHVYPQCIWAPDLPYKSSQTDPYDYASLPVIYPEQDTDVEGVSAAGVNGGSIDEDDLPEFEASELEPIVTNFYGWKVGAGVSTQRPPRQQGLTNALDGIVVANSDHVNGRKRWFKNQNRSRSHYFGTGFAQLDNVYEEEGKVYMHLSFLAPGEDLHDGNFDWSGVEINGNNSIAGQLQGIWGGGFFTKGNGGNFNPVYESSSAVYGVDVGDKMHFIRDEEEFPLQFGDALTSNTQDDDFDIDILKRKRQIDFEGNYDFNNEPKSSPPGPGNGIGYDLNYSDLHYNQWNPAYNHPQGEKIEAFLYNMKQPGAKFRFSADTSNELYTVKSWKEKRLYNHTCWRFDSYWDEAEDAFIIRDNSVEAAAIRWADTCGDGVEPSSLGSASIDGYDSLETKIKEFGAANNRRVVYILELDKNPNLSASYAPTSGQIGADTAAGIEFIGTSANVLATSITIDPAIVETKPKENAELDIYYEASDILPLNLTLQNVGQYAPLGCRVEFVDFDKAAMGLHGNFYLRRWREIDGHLVFDIRRGGSNLISNFSAANWYDPEDNTVALDYTNVDVRFYRTDGSYTTATITNDFNNFDDNSALNEFSGLPSENNDSVIMGSRSLFTVSREINPGKQYGLSWYNCFSFGDGVESNRIRDDFNQMIISNGAKASTTIERPYAEEHRKSGMIYSGIYNSNAGVNNLNQFIAAEKITKDLNPTYGSIQKLYSRTTDLIALCEDRVIKILANKDALFNADGTPQLVASENVLGQAIPFAGDFGISKNPESFASESYRSYFTDKQRGAVLRLSQDGLTPISSNGMNDWFRENFKAFGTQFIGTYDNYKKQYNLTLGGKFYDNIILNSFIEDGEESIESFPGYEVITNAGIDGGDYQLVDWSGIYYNYQPDTPQYGVTPISPTVNRSLSFKTIVKNHPPIYYGDLQAFEEGEEAITAEAAEPVVFQEAPTGIGLSSYSGPIIYYWSFTSTGNGNPFGYNPKDQYEAVQAGAPFASDYAPKVQSITGGAIIRRSVEGKNGNDNILDESTRVDRGVDTWAGQGGSSTGWKIPNNNSSGIVGAGAAGFPFGSLRQSEGRTWSNWDGNNVWNGYQSEYFYGEATRWCQPQVENNGEEKPNVWWHCGYSGQSSFGAVSGASRLFEWDDNDEGLPGPFQMAQGSGGDPADNVGYGNTNESGTATVNTAGPSGTNDIYGTLEDMWWDGDYGSPNLTDEPTPIDHGGIIFSNLYFGQSDMPAGNHNTWIEAPHNYYQGPNDPNPGVQKNAPTYGANATSYAFIPEAIALEHGGNHASIFHGEEIYVRFGCSRSATGSMDADHRYRFWCEIWGDGALVDSSYLDPENGVFDSLGTSSTWHPDFLDEGSIEMDPTPLNAGYGAKLKWRFKDPSMSASDIAAGKTSKIFDKLTVRVGVTAYGNDGNDTLQNVQWARLNYLKVEKVRWATEPYVGAIEGYAGTPDTPAVPDSSSPNWDASIGASGGIPGWAEVENAIQYAGTWTPSNSSTVIDQRGIDTYGPNNPGSDHTQEGFTFYTGSSNGVTSYNDPEYPASSVDGEDYTLYEHSKNSTVKMQSAGASTFLSQNLDDDSKYVHDNWYLVTCRLTEDYDADVHGQLIVPGVLGNASGDLLDARLAGADHNSGHYGYPYAHFGKVEGAVAAGAWKSMQMMPASIPHVGSAPRLLVAVFQYKMASQDHGSISTGDSYYNGNFSLQGYTTNLEIETIMLFNISENRVVISPDDWAVSGAADFDFPHALDWFIEDNTITNTDAYAYAKDSQIIFNLPDPSEVDSPSYINWSNTESNIPSTPSYDGYDFKFTLANNPDTNTLEGGLKIRLSSPMVDGVWYGVAVTLDSSQLGEDEYWFRINFDDEFDPIVLSHPEGTTPPTIERAEVASGWSNPVYVTSSGQSNKIIFFPSQNDGFVGAITSVSLVDATNVFTGGSIGSWSIDLGIFTDTGTPVDPTLENWIAWDIDTESIAFNNAPGWTPTQSNQRVSQQLNTEYILEGQYYQVTFDYDFSEGSVEGYFWTSKPGYPGFTIPELSGSGTYNAIHQIGDDHWGDNPSNLLDSFTFYPSSGPVTGTIDNIKMSQSTPPGFEPKTISFSEAVNGWVSFKSFHPEQGGSLANVYYTFKDGSIYEHNHDDAERNNFYDKPYSSEVEFVMNDGPHIVKSFNTINYDGSDGRILSYSTNPNDLDIDITAPSDFSYRNATSQDGWYVKDIMTDLQKGSIDEFVKKEGRWSNYIKGSNEFLHSSEEKAELNVQGLGFITSVEIIDE